MARKPRPKPALPTVVLGIDGDMTGARLDFGRRNSSRPKKACWVLLERGEARTVVASSYRRVGRSTGAMASQEVFDDLEIQQGETSVGYRKASFLDWLRWGQSAKVHFAAWVGETVVAVAGVAVSIIALRNDNTDTAVVAGAVGVLLAATLAGHLVGAYGKASRLGPQG